MSSQIVLSHRQIEPVLTARQKGEGAVSTSLDLGLTRAEVSLGAERVVFPDGQWLPWEILADISQSETGCFVVEDNEAIKDPEVLRVPGPCLQPDAH